MKTFVRISEGYVREVIVADQLPELHPDVAALFIEAPDGVQEYWTFDGAIWSPPPPYPAE